MRKLTVDYEQHARNQRADPSDQRNGKTSETYTYKNQAIQDQENTQQNPFQAMHIISPFS
jgi:hypothetical protein